MSDTFSLTLRQEGDYRFVVDFDQAGLEPLVVDEPPPLGDGAGPNAARLLAVAVANCLAASLLFCLRKARLEPSDIVATVDATLVRDEHHRLRIGRLDVKIHPTLGAEEAAKASRCIDVFEDFCLVTQSVRHGIDVQVEVEPRVASDRELHPMATSGA